MSPPAQRRAYSFSEYLDVEARSPDVKHEYVDGDILAMAGGSIAHAALSGAIVGMLSERLRGGPCRVYSSDLRIRIAAANVATYADASVICGQVESDPESASHATNPRVVVEVLSPSTEAYDRTEKLPTTSYSRPFATSYWWLKIAVMSKFGTAANMAGADPNTSRAKPSGSRHSGWSCPWTSCT